MNPKTCLVPIERIDSPAYASRQGELTMDSPYPSLPEPTPTPNPPPPPDPSPFPGPPVTVDQFTHLLSYYPRNGS